MVSIDNLIWNILLPRARYPALEALFNQVSIVVMYAINKNAGLVQ